MPGPTCFFGCQSSPPRQWTRLAPISPLTATHVIQTVDRLGRWLYPMAQLLVMLTALVL